MDSARLAAEQARIGAERIAAERVRTIEPPSPTATPAAPAAAPTPSPAEIRAEVARLVQQYARAIESRDVGEIRELYPRMTSAQQKAWEQFFGSVRSLKATLAPSPFEVSNGGADLQVSGTYEFTLAATGRTERQPVKFSATAWREGGGWRLVTVR